MPFELQRNARVLAASLALVTACDGRAERPREATDTPSTASGDFRARFATPSGDSVPLFDGGSRVTVIHVGAASCALCLTTLPLLAKLRGAFGDSAVRTVIVLMDARANARIVERFVTEHGEEGTIVLDPEHRVRDIVQLIATPGLVVLDRQGAVKLAYPGRSSSLGGMAELAVREALGR